MLSQLQLRDFRCFEALRVDFGSEFTFLVGANGEGKTSILEAACVVLRLQSQRSASLGPLVRLGAKAFAIRGIFNNHTLEVRHGGVHRQLRFDDVLQKSAAEYLRIARVVSMANADIELVRGSSEARRRYLDFVGAQIESAYRPTLRAYERALRSRNALLKSPQPRPREIAAYDLPLIENGTRLRTMREKIVRLLAPNVTEAHHTISESKEKIDISFSPGNAEDFAADLAASREKEMRLRQTVVGPHRDDIDLFVDGMPANVYASEGQQRTFALALKIGQARIFTAENNSPLFLIDDIFGELDTNRRNALLSALPAQSQKLITATTLQWRKNFDGATVFELHDRQLRQL